jgi:MarR family transcriptional regulator, temperature-dependent positive regulator of motility
MKKQSATVKCDVAPTGVNLVPAVHRVPAHLARRFNQICVGAMAEIMSPEGIMPREYAVIATIADVPGLDQRTLATRLGIDPASAGQMLDRLEDMELVDRRVHPVDRRARVLRLTARGVKLRQRLIPAARAAHDRIMAPLSPAERGLFIEFLVRIVEANESYARPGNGRRRPGATS